MGCDAAKLENLIDGNTATRFDAGRDGVFFVVLLSLDTEVYKRVVVFVPAYC